MKAKTEKEKDRWRRASEIVGDEYWSITNLKSIEQGEGPAYRRALDLGIADGIARRFTGELRLYKPHHRRQKGDAALLQGIHM